MQTGQVIQKKRKSTSGSVFLLGTTAFSWKSKPQPIVAASTLDAEYIAQSYCVREALWIRKILDNFGFHQRCIPFYADDQGAIGLAKESKLTARTKRIDVSYHLVVDYQDKGFTKKHMFSIL